MLAIVAETENAVWRLVTGATDYLHDLLSHWWFLLLIALIALLDSIFPVVPSETAVITGGVAAGQGQYFVGFVIIAGAVGAFIGDNLAYQIGDSLKGPLRRRAERREKFAARLDWAARQIRTRGGLLLITARFIPGGRTLLTLSCGITDQPRGWFVGWVAIATAIWATYGATLGYIFGEAFEDDHTMAFLIAFGTALAITAIIEVVRHLRGTHDETSPPD